MALCSPSLDNQPPFAGQDLAAFRRAAAHSRRVRILRVLLPLGSILAVVAIVAASMMPSLAPVEPAADPVELTGSTVSMDKPKLAGFNQDGRAYEVTALRAEQSLEAPTRIRLATLAARMDMQDSGWARLEAPEGLLESKDRVLDLLRGAALHSAAGDDARFETARVDFQSGRIVTDRPVWLQTGSATLSADRMELSRSGSTVLFEGHVVMVMRPEPEVAAAAPMPGTPR